MVNMIDKVVDMVLLWTNALMSFLLPRLSPEAPLNVTQRLVSWLAGYRASCRLPGAFQWHLAVAIRLQSRGRLTIRPRLGQLSRHSRIIPDALHLYGDPCLISFE